MFLRKKGIMFNKGECIIYGAKGVCEIQDITTLNLDGVSKNRLYYELSPINKKNSKIFVPVDSNKTIMRKLLSKDEANELIKELPDIPVIQVESDKMREEKYKEFLRSCDCKDWVRIAKTLYFRMKKREKEGKKITSTDEKYFRMAEDYVLEELGFVLEVSREKMEKYIVEHIE